MVKTTAKQRQMTGEQADTMFGKIIYKTTNVVVRAQEKEDGTVVLVTHSLSDDGHEQIPLAYMGGVNYLSYYKRK